MSSTFATRLNWHLPMRARSIDEPNRAATPLELFFDLCFVAAAEFAADSLHSALTGEHIGDYLFSYISVFGAIWWAWLNFTWFASAYDTDDALYRIVTFVQIAGCLVLAAGVPRAFDHGDYTAVVIGYVIMRLAIVFQWLRAAHGDPEHRSTALRYAAGIVIVQIGWVLRLALPDDWSEVSFVVLFGCEMSIPIIAERANMTTWHPEHIAERYGLFTIIMLGEAVLSVTRTVEEAINDSHRLGHIIPTSVSGLIIVCAIWWVYFHRAPTNAFKRARDTFLWGYGHYFIFASIVAVGAALETVVTENEMGVFNRDPGIALAIAASIFVVASWLIQVRTSADKHQHINLAMPIAVPLILLAGLTHYPAQLIAAVFVLLVVADEAPSRNRTPIT